MDQGGFAGPVGQSQGAGPQAGNGRDVHNRAAAGLDHELGKCQGADESPVQVGGHDRAPFLERGVQRGLKHSDARIVDQGVHAPESGHHLRRCLFDLRWIGDIALNAKCIIRAGDFCRRAVERGFVNIQKYHSVALAKKPFNDGKTDATGCASDNSNTGICLSAHAVFRRGEGNQGR